MIFECPKCRELIDADDELAGRQGKCPHCKAKVPVPALLQPLPQQPKRTRPPGNSSSGAGFTFILLAVGAIVLIAIFSPPTTPHDKGYDLGLSAGRDFADSGANATVDDGILIYMIRDRLETDPEIRKGYREGFQKAYSENIMKGFYRR